MTIEYEAFFEDPELVKERVERKLSIRELTPRDRRMKYRTRYVRALVYPNPDREKDDILWIRYLQGGLHPKPFGIKILEELGPFEVKEKSVLTA